MIQADPLIMATLDKLLADQCSDDVVNAADNGQWQQVHIERANFIASALPLPAGEHQLLLRYQPATVRTGSWLSLAGFTLLLILQVTFRRRARRDPGLKTG